jgi:hypothetical protein
VILLFYCGVQSEHGTKNQENREGVVTVPTPGAGERFQWYLLSGL